MCTASTAACLLLLLWQVAIRKRAGITASSKLEILAAEHDMYVARINGNVMLKLGPRYDMGGLVPQESQGWKLAASGQDFAVWDQASS
jgi:alpha-amylase